MINSPIEEIKNRLDIVEVIGSYIKLQKAGANYRAICPFHSEKKPSFFVSPARQIWHCFGCQKGGSIFNFIMEIEGVEFGDALRLLAQKAGIELQKQDPKLKTERNLLCDISEMACLFFEKQLQTSRAGRAAKKYLLERGINEESIKKWRLGYAPDTWQGLSDFLVSKGYKREDIEKAGLAIKKEKGNFYDRFRRRIMFPIFDMNSQIIGFGGRVFGNAKRPDGSEEAKYINTPGTLLYDKSRVLYGLDKAKIETRRKDACIIVEGYTDVIMSHQTGIKNVVAASGTALTPYQLKILKRYSENLFTAFDMDVAGDSATKRGINLAQTQGFNIRVVVLSEEMDPADIILKDPKEWQKRIEEAKSILEFYFENTFSQTKADTPQGKKEISKILLPVIKRIPNKIEQSHWVQELARRLEVKESAVVEELKKAKSEPSEHFSDFSVEEEKEPAKPQKSRKELLEERICLMLFRFPEKFSHLNDNDFDFFSPQISQILTCFKSGSLEKDDFQVRLSEARQTLEEERRELFDYLLLKSEVEEETDQSELELEFSACLKEMRALCIKNKLSQISQDIRKAEEEKNFERINQLTQDFNKLAQGLNNF